MLTPVDDVPSLPARPVVGHKGTFGTVALVAGSAGMLGAAILAARGALRGGAGLVRCVLPSELMAPLTIAVPAATTLARGTAIGDWLVAVDVVVCGPGLSMAPVGRSMIDELLSRSTVPVLLDADGLNLLAPVAATWTCTAPIIVTPHPGEAGRLLGCSAAAVQADRLAAVTELWHRLGGVVVLKGAGTLVTDGRWIYRNQTGNPGLGTGGSGDVLAGLIGALVAQGMPAFDAARLGVWAHGRAGDLVAQRLSSPGLCAEDLPLAIAEVLA